MSTITCNSCRWSYPVGNEWGDSVLACNPNGAEEMQLAGIPCLKYAREITAGDSESEDGQ